MGEAAPAKQQAWPFQQRVNALVTAGHNVVLQAPTGSGKTRAALEPFVLNLTRGQGPNTALPCTCRYAVPLRTLANQFYKEYNHLDVRIDNRGRTELKRIYDRLEVNFVEEQTGEHSNDRRFEAGLTFCTIDQLLAAFLGLPYGVSPQLTNMKVAGVFGSYLVLDEWHLYPLRAVRGMPGRTGIEGARSTSLVMLQLLNQQRLGRFVLMTATFSTTLLSGLADLLGARLETLRQGAYDRETEDEAFTREYQQIAAGRVRTLCRAPTPLEQSIDEILDEHTGSTLVICNQVERAQAMYLRLREACARRGTEAPKILLLHSRFTDERRTELAKRVEDELGKEAWEERTRGLRPQPNFIVVATQVVEVGLNISAQSMHTDEAPANSLVQRAGRCARFAGQEGHVTVHPLPVDASSLPYATRACKATLEALPDSPTTFDFAREHEQI